jgi:hypothetical protein
MCRLAGQFTLIFLIEILVETHMMIPDILQNDVVPIESQHLSARQRVVIILDHTLVVDGGL